MVGLIVDCVSFTRSLAGASPPEAVSAPLTALWWAARGEWDRAHRLVQEEDSPDAAWVHAYLHRVEGDLSNARYWYCRAKRPTATGALEYEWDEIVRELLKGEGS
jgi:hypothetical protein